MSRARLHAWDVGTARLVSTADAAVRLQRTQNYKETTSHRYYRNKRRRCFLGAPFANRNKTNGSHKIRPRSAWTGKRYEGHPWVFIFSWFVARSCSLLFNGHHSRVVKPCLRQIKEGKKNKNQLCKVFQSSSVLFKLLCCWRQHFIQNNLPDSCSTTHRLLGRQQGGYAGRVEHHIYKMEFYMLTVAKTICQGFLQSRLKLGGSDCTSCHASRPARAPKFPKPFAALPRKYGSEHLFLRRKWLRMRIWSEDNRSVWKGSRAQLHPSPLLT